MTNRIAEELFDSVRSDFISHLDRVSKRHGTVNPTRVGVLDDKSVENIKNNKRIDHRRIKMMTISGKGSRQYPDTMNVSLFDHSLDVGCGAARLAAHDLTQGEWDPDKLSSVLAMTMVQGFAHDPDKNYGVKSQDITIEHVQDFINTWDLDGFMRRYNVNLQASHLLTYISAVEVRSSVHSSPPGISNQFLTCARRYVRLADNLSSKYLASYTNKDINLSKEWASLKSHLQNPNAFDEYEEFAFSDVHHPFLLDRFQQQLYAACIAVANVPPLFCSLMDGTLTVYLPKKSSDEIIDMASEFLAEDLPLGTKIFVSMQGSMKISGPSPVYSDLEQIIENTLFDQNGVKLFTVKSLDFRNEDGTSDNDKNYRLDQLVKVALRANCPTLEKLMPGKLTYIVARQKFDSPTLSSVKFAATVAFLLGVQQTSKNKELTPQKRLEKIIEIFGIDIPEWLSKVDVLTRRTFIALSVAAVIRENPELKLKFDEWANYLLANDGLFEGYQDRDNEVKNAVLTHYKDIAFGVFKSPEDAPYRCLVTGVPVTNEWKIGQVDQLHVIKSSAFSYREGRSEEKFKETADAHISPVAFAEFKLRQVMDDIRVGKYGGRKASSIPVSLMSPVHTGFFGSQYVKADLWAEDFSLYDFARENIAKGKVTIDPISLYQNPARIARFESIGNTFLDRVKFFRMAIETSMRVGRPIHIFNGLPHFTPEFFYADCMGRNLEMLLGGTGLRLEELSGALNKLRIIEYLSTSKSDKGLGEVELAKSFCFPTKRFHAAILAWLLAIRTDTPNSLIVNTLFNDIIPEEIKKMGNIPPEIKLATLARGVQRAPLPRESNSVLEFIIRTSFEVAETSYAKGRRSPEYLIPAIKETLYKEAVRRHNSSGFFSGAHTREKDVSPEQQLDKVADVFVNEIWFGLLNGRPCKHSYKRLIFAAYIYGFKNAEIPLSKTV